MNGYVDLPLLVPVMDTLLGYLNVKQRIKFKSVCRSWKAEIERREQKNDTLVLHCGPYLWNVRWNPAIGERLMKFEHSFEMKTTSFLDHPLTRSRLQKTKRLAIVHVCKSLFTPVVANIQSNLQPYLGYFDQCEEIELKNFQFEGTLTFDLPKLRMLVIDGVIKKLTLNCPSLEVLSWTWQVQNIAFQNVPKLKRIICFSWPKIMRVPTKFESLQYLNMFGVGGENANGHLLELMPKLKRLVLYTNDPRTDQQFIRKRQKRGLADLKLLLNGFRDPVKLDLQDGLSGLVRINRCIERVFDNYSNLEENSPWPLRIDYSTLFNKFKILPSDFCERFSEPFEIEIREVTNYTHLLGFLKCYPAVQKLWLHWSKVEAGRILDLVHCLQPSLAELVIVEERAADLLEIDVSFMHLFNLVIVHVESTHLPAEFVRKVAAKRGAYFNMLVFNKIASGPSGDHHQISIYFEYASNRVALIDNDCGSNSNNVACLEHLLIGVQEHPHWRSLFLS